MKDLEFQSYQNEIKKLEQQIKELNEEKFRLNKEMFEKAGRDCKTVKEFSDTIDSATAIYFNFTNDYDFFIRAFFQKFKAVVFDCKEGICVFNPKKDIIKKKSGYLGYEISIKNLENYSYSHLDIGFFSENNTFVFDSLEDAKAFAEIKRAVS